MFVSMISTPQSNQENMEMKTLVLVLHVFFSLVVHSDSSSSSFNANPVDQQEKDRVVELPGLSFNVSFAHYSGYVTANEFSGRSLFYWFFEAVDDPSSKPIVLWLQGGPGCSSIGLGQAVELGSFHINPDGKTIHLNPYSWNQVANILFVDSPVGAGFSYSKTPHDLLTNGDKRTAEDSLMFLLNWFERFPQYKGRDFYIVGESYAGHYIPQLAQAIVRHQLSHSKTSINLKGYMVGNGLTDDYNDQRGVTEYMWSAGLISDQTYKLKTLHCTHVSYLYSSEECDKVAKIVTSELGNIDIYSVFTPKCTSKVSSSDKLSKRRLIARSLGDKYDPCSEEYAEVYFNLPEVQKALHVNPEAIPYKWVACSDVYKTWTDSASSVLDIYHELINSGLRVWIFSGDTDTVIPVTAARYNVEALNLPPAAPWHPWYDDEQVGGWTEQYVGLTFVSIKGAGHKVPMTKPKLALVLFKSFLSGSPMPTLSESKVLIILRPHVSEQLS